MFNIFLVTVITIFLYLACYYFKIFPVDILYKIITFTGMLAALVALLSFLPINQFKSIISNSLLQIYNIILFRIRLKFLCKHIFVGREKEIDLIRDLCSFNYRSVKVIYFYSFPGIGKTYLLNYLWIQKLAKYNYLVQCNKDENFVTVAIRAFPAILKFKRNYTTQYEILNLIAEKINNNSLILIDEYQYNNDIFNNEFIFFLDKLLLKQKKLLFVIAARECPKAKYGLFQFYKLLEFTDGETYEFVNKKWKNKRIHNNLISKIKFIKEVTKGNPKLIEYICGNENYLERVIQDKNLELGNLESINKFFLDIWKELLISDSKYCEQLKTISAINFVTEIWDDKICNKVFEHTEWLI